MIELSTVHLAVRAQGALAATLALLNAGSTGSVISFFSTARPTLGDTPGAASLVDVVLAKPAGTITDGVLTLTLPGDTLILVSGVALWARVTSGMGSAQLVFDSDVSNNAGTANIKLANTQLYAGGILRVTSIVLD